MIEQKNWAHIFMDKKKWKQNMYRNLLVMQWHLIWWYDIFSFLSSFYIWKLCSNVIRRHYFFLSKPMSSCALNINQHRKYIRIGSIPKLLSIFSFIEWLFFRLLWVSYKLTGQSNKWHNNAQNECIQMPWSAICWA